MQNDVFPATLRTWIDARIDEGEAGRHDLNHHIMSVYAWPLRVYFLGSRDRWLGEPDDVIQGFMADRLQKEDFFREWRRSGMRLRRWLINAFCFYLKELRRKNARNNQFAELENDASVPGRMTPEQEFDRAYVVSIVKRALDTSAAQCEAEGLGEHWRVFVRHYYHGQPYPAFAQEFGVDAARAAVMARTAQRKFRAVLRELISRDAPPDDLDAEIRALLEDLES